MKAEPKRAETAKVPLHVLCVDDEANILKSMKRLLFREDFTLFLADSGARALEIMAGQPIDLVVSDMKMPNMTGAELLAEVAKTYPDTYRIILTGYADLSSTVDAVNKGKIHRYMQKPWDNEELLDAIRTGLEHVRVKRDNARLQALLAKQNHLLKDVNHNLEEKVELRTRQIRAALHKLEKNNDTTIKLLVNFICIHPLLSGGFANNVSQLAKRLAKAAKADDVVKDVTHAGLLCELGLLGADNELISTPFNALNFQQQQEYLTQPNIAQMLLGPAPHLQSLIDLLTCQYEYFNGQGVPNKLQAEQIPLGARILSIARDIWRHVDGKMTGERLTVREAIKELVKHRGTRYDPDILDILVANPDLVTQTSDEKVIAVTALKPGMTLAANVLNDNHILILPEGHEFTGQSIAKLQTYAQSQKGEMQVHIVKPKVPATRTATTVQAKEKSE